jgi:hypothetical protein
MDVNDDVLSQGIVFASILAGFSFSLAARLVVSKRAQKTDQVIAGGLFDAGFISLTAVAMGIVQFATQDHSDDVETIGWIFIGLLLYAAGTFIIAMTRMFRKYVTDDEVHGSLRRTVVAICVIVAFGIIDAIFL